MKEKRKTSRLKWVGISGITLLIILFVLFLFVNAYIDRSLPQVSGSIKLSGIKADVTVTRDDKGVPHIRATSEEDLYFAQGFVQAQDRLFQMDLSRRQASGRLSEVVGEAALDRDRFFRTLGLRRAAEASYAGYGEESKKILQAFADGINAYINLAKREGRFPIEFTLLQYEPEPWRPIDSLTIGKYMAFDLGGHWEGQAFRLWALQNLSKEKAEDLFPTYPAGAPTILKSYEGIRLPIEKIFAKAVIPEEWNGSNNWVVSGERTKSGKPILANDPHLSLSTPSIWYQMHLESPAVNVSGVIFAGVPGIIIGHNEQIAWGVTNTGPDVQDLYIEKRNPKDQTQFLYQGKWEKGTVIEEPIRVKGGKVIPFQVIYTRHGPVISEFAFPSKDDTVLSLRWTALDSTQELQAILGMDKAKSWTEFEKALEDFQVPTQNFVFASADGTIAYKANGRIPIRKKGDGLLPVPGWTGEYEWTGYIPYDKLPRVVNPPEGFIATANNKVVGREYPYHISNQWAEPYRYMRIEEKLQGKKDLTVEAMERLQMDQKNGWAEELLPGLLNAMKGKQMTEMEKEGLNLLQNWNGVDSADQAAPLIFHSWMQQLQKYLFEEEIPNEVLSLFEGKQGVVNELIRKAMRKEVSRWFTDKGGFPEVLHTTYRQTIEALSKRQGGSPSSWMWGKEHRLYFAHPMSDFSPILRFLFNREEPVPVGGSHITVQAASFNDEGIVDHGASWRFVIDLAEPAKGYHIVGPGQAGHWKSKWYHDQIMDWVTGRYHLTPLKGSEKGEVLHLVRE